MVKKLAFGFIILTCAYVLVTGDYTFAGPRYRLLGYGLMAADALTKSRAASNLPALTARSDIPAQTAARSRLEPSRATRPATDAQVQRPAAARSFVHLGSLRSSDSARREWLRLKHEFPAVLSQLDVTLQRVNLGARGVYYRVLADTARSPLSPGELCAKLRETEQYCSVVMTEPTSGNT